MSDYEIKICKMYQKKHFQMNLNSFFKFLQDKVEIDQTGIYIYRKKLQEFKISQSFDENTLAFLFRLVTAVQTQGEKVKKFTFNEIRAIQSKIKFKQKSHLNQERDQSYQANLSKQAFKKDIRQKVQMKRNQDLEEIQQLEVQQKSEKNILHKNRGGAKQQNRGGKKQQKSERKLGLKKEGENQSEIKLNNKGINIINMKESKEKYEKVRISEYDKFFIDYVNPVIKYTIVYKNDKQYKVLRRFSEFERLINILRENNEGYILPKLPPKEGIKAGINYFWGTDEGFLQDRKIRLEKMLNHLLKNKFLNKDQTLLKFLTQKEFAIEQNNQESYSSYLKSLTDIVFNVKQLKDLGVAYYNYLKEKGNVKLDSQIQLKYAQILELVQVFTSLNVYRKKINTNFDKRRQLNHYIEINSRMIVDSNFDEAMNEIEEEIQYLNFEYQNYKELKCQESWIIELIKQKGGDSQKIINDLEEQKKKLSSKLHNIEKNFKLSLEEFYLTKSQQLRKISQIILIWRSKVHP